MSEQYGEDVVEVTEPDEAIDDVDIDVAAAAVEPVEAEPASEAVGADVAPGAGPEADLGGSDDIDALEDGSALTGTMPVRDDVPGSDVLFTLSSREQFAALDDPEATGDARVDAAAARLAELPDLPTPDHVAVYDDVHRRLQDALADAEVT